MCDEREHSESKFYYPDKLSNFFSSEDFPASGVLLQRSDEATEEKAVFDTLLAGRSTVAKETQKNLTCIFICDYTSALWLICNLPADEREAK